MASDLFPVSTSINAGGLLAVDARHSLYWEESGRMEGDPVVILHGGPGSGMQAWHRRLFDPRHFRVVCFDQRGAGRSEPRGELVDNTTDHLVSDIERLRAHLGIDRWLVAGGSWGSSLALAYATRHADRVAGLLLRGIFTCTRAEIDWFLHGVRHVFPEAWRRFADHVTPPEREDLLTAYRARLADADPSVHLPAAGEWCRYERSCSSLLPDAVDDPGAPAREMLVLARIQTHYFAHAFFMHEGALLEGTRHLRGVPGAIVQGRYDMICPVVSADRLHRAWPEAHYEIVPNAGHAGTEPGIRRALVRATERFRIRL